MAPITEKELNEHCVRQHLPLEKRIDRIDGRMWNLILLAIVQLCGIAATLFVVLIQNGRGA